MPENIEDEQLKVIRFIWGEYCKMAYEMGAQALPELLKRGAAPDPIALMRNVNRVLEEEYLKSGFCPPEDRDRIMKRNEQTVTLGAN